MAKNATIRATLRVGDEGTAAFGVTPMWSGLMDMTVALVEGTDAGEFDLAYMAERTVTTGANDDIDLAGVLTDAFGNAITAAEIVALMVINKPKGSGVNTTNLTLGADGAAISPWVGLLNAAATVGPLKPGAVFLTAASDAAGIGSVTASTGDVLRIANSAGASNTYQIAILARSA